MRWLFLLVFGGIGLVGIIVGSIWGSKRYALWHTGIRVSGTVVDIHAIPSPRNNRRSSMIYTPIVEFTAQDGKVYRFRGSTGTSYLAYERGAHVDVIYNPLAPSVAQLSDFTQFWLGPLCIGFVGLIMLIVGIVSFLPTRGAVELEQKMEREELFIDKRGIKLDATVREIRTLEGRAGPRYIVVCSGGVPGGVPRDFMSPPLSIDPGSSIIGKSVEIYADPVNVERYHVRLDMLLGAGAYRTHR